MNILVVDDEILAIQYLTGLLEWEAYGYRIVAAAFSVAEAKKYLKDQEIDLVIFDVSMPEESGVRLSEYIAKNHPDVKMLAISSFDTYDYVREILKNGAFDYLLKHQLSADLLLSVLQKIESQMFIAPKRDFLSSPSITIQRLRSENKPTNIQLAIPLNLQSKLITAIDSLDYEKVKAVVVQIYDQEGSDSTTSKLLIAKEILDFFNRFAGHNSIEFEYDKEVSELIRFTGEAGTETIAAHLMLLFEKLIDLLELPSSSHFVRKARRYIERFYTSDISLQQCARSIGVNKSYLSRIFHQEVGVTFSRYVNQLRVNHAKTEIMQGFPLKQVALRCGFRNYNYFFKIFKDFEGITPLGFAEQAKVKKIE